MNLRISTLFLATLAVAAGGCDVWHNNHGFNGNGQLALLDAGCDPNGDICGAAGLACTPLLPSASFTCQLPGAFYACDPGVGCAGDLQCVDGACLQGCAATADCLDPLTVCAALQSDFGDAGTFCLLDTCGDAGTFWQPCDDGGGTCLLLISDPEDGTLGACMQGGAVAAGGNCQYYRGDGGLCTPGLICTADGAGDNAGICLPVCDPFADGGPSCASGTACVESAIPAAPPVSFFDYDNHSGVCAQGCVSCFNDAGCGYPGPMDAGEPADAGDAADAGTVDAGVPDAGSPNSVACPAPTSCTNASLTTTPTFVCLP